MKFVSRSEWGAKPAKNEMEPFGGQAARYIIISQYKQDSQCTDLEECCAYMRNIQAYHMNEQGECTEDKLIFVSILTRCFPPQRHELCNSRGRNTAILYNKV